MVNFNDYSASNRHQTTYRFLFPLMECALQIRGKSAGWITCFSEKSYDNTRQFDSCFTKTVKSVEGRIDGRRLWIHFRGKTTDA